MAKLSLFSPITANVEALCSWGIDQQSAVNEAKYKTKSRSLELMPGRITSAKYKAGICTADDSYKVTPQAKKPMLAAAFA